MPKSMGQKLKILYILNFLEEYTDENHAITTAQIQDKLSELGIAADRKTIYSDISNLIDMGYEIETEATRNGGGWKLLSRKFEMPELKLLVDAVQSSRFITPKKSKELIKKLETLISSHEATKLNRQVFVASRVKSGNESVFYNIDFIHRAIQENKKISFTYMEWNVNKELVQKGISIRVLSPWALIWKDENYYLLAFDDKDGNRFKHFRVDKMQKVNLTDEPRKGGREFEKIDLATYADTTFGMMGGKQENVVLEFPSELVGVVIDRFGKDVTIQKVDGGKIKVRTKVVISPQFFGWLAGLGPNCKILSPDTVNEKYISYLKEIIASNCEK